jgi:serine/threonine protein kinase
VHLEATMETENIMCIVLEYVQGGELFEFVQKMHQQSRMTQDCQVDEVAVKKVFLQLLHAVKWLHEHNIVHRGLKLGGKFFFFFFFFFFTFLCYLKRGDMHN